MSARTDYSPLQRFLLLKEKVLRRKRIEGIYVLEAAEVPLPAKHGAPQQNFIRSFASQFGFSEPHIGEREWMGAEAFRDDARRSIIESLAGGAEIGHSRWDVPPNEAEVLADEFLSLFADEARFFCSSPPAAGTQPFAPLDRPDSYEYIYGGGCIAIDPQIAAIFWMLDND